MDLREPSLAYPQFQGTIMTSYFRIPLLAGLAATVFSVGISTVTPASANGAPFCIARSGVNGSDSYVSNCIYASYEQCSAAATGSRGHCVGNVEYRGGASAMPAPHSRRVR
jgi:hypothetical protein